MSCASPVMTAAWLALMPLGAFASSAEEVYLRTCAACHQADGEGTPGLAPPLAGSLGGIGESAEGRAYIASVMVSGMAGTIVTRGQRFTGVMPAQAALSDDELAAAANHILARFNSGKATISAAEVAARRSLALTPNDVRRMRDKLISAVAAR